MAGFAQADEVFVSYEPVKPKKPNKLFKSSGTPTGIVGHIYLDTGGLSAADVCIYIRDDGTNATWEYATDKSAEPGLYSQTRYNGDIDDRGRLAGFPKEGFADAVAIWKTGGIQATIDDREIPNSR